MPTERRHRRHCHTITTHSPAIFALLTSYSPSLRLPSVDRCHACNTSPPHQYGGHLDRRLDISPG
ncbi:hypothetical protein HMPREF9569_02556 [Cutibacterium acnes HL078PA1]|nr:hypothetical protein HMPREF9612_01607 [Cutibacterium acnes HL063PA2]EFT51923.1 hypothetical protein HMPREF9569_02556 [Cutibacterium acnes HL078PA1]